MSGTPSSAASGTRVAVVPRPSLSKRIPELDGLRGIAILLVLIWHFFVTPSLAAGGPASSGVTSFLLAMGRLTWSGVDLFFVLSGFLIGGILLDARDSSNYFKVFYIRRFCRILPVYAATCAVFWAGRNFATGHPASVEWIFSGPMHWLTYVTFTQNIAMTLSGGLGAQGLAATWSLAVEEQFYLTLPLLIWFLSPRRLAYVLAAAILAAPVLRALLYLLLPQGGVGAYVLMPCRADSLMLGVLAALALRRDDVWLVLTRQTRLLKGIGLVLGLGVILFTVRGWTIGTLPMSTLGYTWLALFYLVFLVLGLTEPHGLLGSVLRNRALRGLGEISYGTYLFHLGVNGLVHGVIRGRSPGIDSPGDVLVGLFALVLTLVIAKASWVYFEWPIVKLGRSFHYEAAASRGKE